MRQVKRSGATTTAPKVDPAFDMAVVRKEILTYCGDLPEIIKSCGANRQDTLASVTLNLGKCFSWVGHRIDRHAVPILQSANEKRTVVQLGEELQALGHHLIKSPVVSGEMDRTINALQKQLDLITEIKGEITKGGVL